MNYGDWAEVVKVCPYRIPEGKHKGKCPIYRSFAGYKTWPNCSLKNCKGGRGNNNHV